MNIPTTDLLEDLTKRTLQNIKDIELLSDFDASILNKKESTEKWSALECIAHLNFYSDFYLPEFDRRIRLSGYTRPSDTFNSGLLGNYFAKIVGPLDGAKKMKTLKISDPIHSEVDPGTLAKFKEHLMQTLVLLEKASEVNLVKTKTSISISKFIKLRLGDGFRVVIYHNQRHIEQALKAVS